MNKYEKDKPSDKTFDARWKHMPCRIYVFPEGPEKYEDLLHFMGEEDNVNYQLVNFAQCFHMFFRKHHSPIGSGRRATSS